MSIPPGWMRITDPPKPLPRKERLRIAALHARWAAEELAEGEFGDGSEHLIVVWPTNDFQRNNPPGWSRTYTVTASV